MAARLPQLDNDKAFISSYDFRPRRVGLWVGASGAAVIMTYASLAAGGTGADFEIVACPVCCRSGLEAIREFFRSSRLTLSVQLKTLRLRTSSQYRYAPRFKRHTVQRRSLSQSSLRDTGVVW